MTLIECAAFSSAYLIVFLGMLIHLIISSIPNKKTKWVYGFCNGLEARKDLKTGGVQFVIFKKGEQKSELHPLGHLEDKWVQFHKSHWSNFKQTK